MVAQRGQHGHGHGPRGYGGEQLPSFADLDRMVRGFPVERRYSSTGKGWSEEWVKLLDARDKASLQERRARS